MALNLRIFDRESSAMTLQRPGRSGRVVECAGLENRWARKGPVGSNPTSSASVTHRLPHRPVARYHPAGMLLTTTTAHRPATDLGYLLYKNPARPQAFELSFGRAHVLPQASEDAARRRCCWRWTRSAWCATARGRRARVFAGAVRQRPALRRRSFLSVAIAQVFGSALSGMSKERPELAKTRSRSSRIAVCPAAAARVSAAALFEPLGYTRRRRPSPPRRALPRVGRGAATTPSTSRQRDGCATCSPISTSSSPSSTTTSTTGSATTRWTSCSATAKAGWRPTPSAQLIATAT